MAPLRYAAKFDPFLSLDCARVEGVGAQSKGKERKGSNFAIWQPCHQEKSKGQKGHRHRSLTANGRGELGGGGGGGGGCSLELSRHFSSSCLAAARLYYSHSRSTSSLRKAVSHNALNKSREVDR